MIIFAYICQIRALRPTYQFKEEEKKSTPNNEYVSLAVNNKFSVVVFELDKSVS